MIIRTAYDSRDNAIANVKNIRQGNTILLVYGGGRTKKPYCPVFSCTVVAPPRPVPGFDALTYADASQHERLQGSNYLRDPRLKRFTGISIAVSRHLEHVTCSIPRPGGINTIRRWNEVFDTTGSTLDKG
jgi:hypothetical protein